MSKTFVNRNVISIKYKMFNNQPDDKYVINKKYYFKQITFIFVEIRLLFLFYHNINNFPPVAVREWFTEVCENRLIRDVIYHQNGLQYETGYRSSLNVLIWPNQGTAPRIRILYMYYMYSRI